MTDRYESPLAQRYASEYMLGLFSADSRYRTWRRLWAALAREEMRLGLPVTPSQVAELEAHIDDIDYDCVRAREKEVRHDVMAHVYAYGKAAPSAAGIIHLGATSCYVTDNADLILFRDALGYLRKELLGVLANLAAFADAHKATPTLGYTHYQPAQLVTVGKRATLWMQDLISDLREIDFGDFEGNEGVYGKPDHPLYKFFFDTENYEATRGAESIEHLLLRVKSFYDDVLKNLTEEGKNVLIVAHGAFNAGMITFLLGNEIKDFWSYGQSNCGLFKFYPEDIQRTIKENESTFVRDMNAKNIAASIYKK